MLADFARWVSNEAHYYVKVFDEEVPIVSYKEAFDEFKDEQKEFKEWWYNFCQELCDIDYDVFDEVLEYDYHNEAKLEAIADWVGHDAIKDRIYKYNISL